MSHIAKLRGQNENLATVIVHTQPVTDFMNFLNTAYKWIAYRTVLKSGDYQLD